MTEPYIIAEAAQGFEGNPSYAHLLVKGAAYAKADAVKFQFAVADEIAQPGNPYYPLFVSHEMSQSEWQSVRNLAAELELDFISDVFGPKSFGWAREVDVDGFKLHSTSFFDNELIEQVLSEGKPTFISIGGIRPEEFKAQAERHGFTKHGKVKILYGFQAEPTPIENNNLARIPLLRERTGLEIGFMDHSHGDEEFTTTLSAVALGLGVRVFEKHLTLERGLEMIDYMSALSPRQLAKYVRQIRGLLKAIGTEGLGLTEAEIGYRNRSVKRVVAAQDLKSGTILDKEKIALSRPAEPDGFFMLEDAIGRKLTGDVKKGMPITVGLTEAS